MESLVKNICLFAGISERELAKRLTKVTKKNVCHQKVNYWCTTNQVSVKHLHDVKKAVEDLISEQEWLYLIHKFYIP